MTDVYPRIPKNVTQQLKWPGLLRCYKRITSVLNGSNVTESMSVKWSLKSKTKTFLAEQNMMRKKSIMVTVSHGLLTWYFIFSILNKLNCAKIPLK